MWSISGMMIIPSDPQLTVTPSNKGVFLNFKAVTQGKNTDGDSAVYQYWDCSLWVLAALEEEWKTKIAPGNVFYVEHANATSYPILEGKYHNTKIRLSQDKLKLLTKPLWFKS
jgi:hypothetical protein